MAEHKRIYGLIGLSLVGVFALMCLSNHHDWGQFFTKNEADLRAWSHNELPLWSYQLCGGITRAGDPESFSLSPIFAFVLLLGSYWGSKAMLWFCMLLGLLFTKLTLQRLLWGWGHADEATEPRPLEHASLFTLAALYLYNNSYLWHLHVGHLPFALGFLALGIFYYSLKAWQGDLRRKDLLPAAFLTYTYYSATIYQSLVFFLIPLLSALGIAMLWDLVARLKRGEWRAWLLRCRDVVGFHLLGIALASYKLYFVLSYQKLYPRKLEKMAREIPDLWGAIPFHLFPVWNGKLLGPFAPKRPFGVWEYTYFNLLLFVFLALLALWLRSGKAAPEANGPEHTPQTEEDRRQGLRLIWIYALVVCGFCLGEAGFLAPHQLVNDLLLSGSSRVVERYQIGLLLALAMGCAWLLASRPRWNAAFVRYAAIPLLLLVQLNFFSFYHSSSFRYAKYLAGLKKNPSERIQWTIVTRPKDGNIYSYRPVTRGLGVLNCKTATHVDHRLWDWVRKDAKMVKLPNGQTVLQMQKVFHVIDTRTGRPNKRCLKESYFTQNELVLGRTCPARVCVNITQPNLYQSHLLRWDPKVQRYCRTLP